jgi:hypothetical protein
MSDSLIQLNNTSKKEPSITSGNANKDDSKKKSNNRNKGDYTPSFKGKSKDIEGKVYQVYSEQRKKKEF